MNGIGKKSHHSDLLQELDIPNVSACVNNSRGLSFCNIIFKVKSPSRCTYLVSQFIATGKSIKYTLVVLLVWVLILLISHLTKVHHMCILPYCP